MRTLISILLLLVAASWLTAAESRPGTSGSVFQYAKSSSPKHKFKKPGKYKRPKIQAKKWKANKEQRKAAAKHPLGRTRV